MEKDGAVGAPINDLCCWDRPLTKRRHKSYRSDSQLQYDRVDDPAVLHYRTMAEYPGHSLLASEAQLRISLVGFGPVIYWLQSSDVLGPDVLLQH